MLIIHPDLLFTDASLRMLFARRLFAVACALLLVGGSPLSARAQDDPLPAVTRTFAITNARVVQAPGQVLERATVVVRDGLIEAVGPSVDIPFDAQRIAGDSLTVYAGFIDGFGHIGIDMPKPKEYDVERPGSPPPGRAGIQPERRAATFLDPSDASVGAWRKIGFTTAHIAPEGQMLPGQGAVALLAGAQPSAMILEAPTSLYAQLEGSRGDWNSSVYPSTPMGVLAQFRQLYRETARRRTLLQQYETSPRGMERPPHDPQHDALLPVVAGERPVAFFSEDVLDIHRILALKNELGFPLMLTGLNESFRAVEALRDADVPLFLTLALPDAPDAVVEDSVAAAPVTPAPQGSFFETDLRTRSHEDVGAEADALQRRLKAEVQRYYATPATLRGAGLRFGFSSKNATATDVRANLRLMLQHGLSEDAALAALTTDAAALLGLSDRLGTVEAGKIANLVVTDGSYFAKDTNVTHVFVEGRVFDYSAEEASGGVTASVEALVGAWSYSVDTPQQTFTGTVTLSGTQETLSGTITSPASGEATPLEDLSFDGTTLSFAFDAGEIGTVSFSGTVQGDTVDGSASSSYGTFPMMLERTDAPQ
ncbi:amidohydrolase family protein [Salisaeta longa]|uniref:amidohydrolase family protein n=1 Tax=Salisaeta longa TaxID=503170 RepID=UPI00146B0384|nr:amidohydrolase family protein [Salisaeta longa]